MLSMPAKGYGKGLPPPGVTMNGMPMSGWQSFGSGYPGPPPPPPQEEGFFNQMFGDDEEPEFIPHTVPYVDHMPIPWQTEKEKEEDAPIVEKVHVGFDDLSLEQLQGMAATRNNTIEALQREIQELTTSDMVHEDRLAKLEKQFGDLTNGSDLKIKAPLLNKIRKVVRESHLLDHDAEMDTMIKTDAEDWGDIDPWAYIHAQNLVLGRSFVGLDQHHIAKMEYQRQLEKDQHPVVHRLHYAGHTSKPAEEVEGVFVKEAGIYKKQPLHPAPYRNQFWLSLAGPTREDAHAAREATNAAMEDPVARRIMRKDEAGTGEDAQAVDWLGKMKRGEMVDAKPKHDPGFRMPSWMY